MIPFYYFFKRTFFKFIDQLLYIIYISAVNSKIYCFLDGMFYSIYSNEPYQVLGQVCCYLSHRSKLYFHTAFFTESKSPVVTVTDYKCVPIHTLCRSNCPANTPLLPWREDSELIFTLMHRSVTSCSPARVNFLSQLKLK